MSNTLQDTFNWFAEAIPQSKITKKAQSVQIGVHIEEFVEMLETIRVQGVDTQIAQAIDLLTIVADHLKKNSTSFVIMDRKEFLDAMVDQIVTATGTGYLQGMDIVGGLDMINQSNYSKFVDGKAVFDINGKISKGPNYFKPNLLSYVGQDLAKE
jgi:predicted HAD superfamily Cof-like phosphohydrolase